ncbi:MAG: hypothetical protein Fur006_59490 [Coleofasciculaceae cyanobacterium]
MFYAHQLSGSIVKKAHSQSKLQNSLEEVVLLSQITCVKLRLTLQNLCDAFINSMANLRNSIEAIPTRKVHN